MEYNVVVHICSFSTMRYLFNILLFATACVLVKCDSEFVTTPPSENVCPEVTQSPYEWLNFDMDPEVFMNAAEIIDYHGYPVEEHVVTTEDGYMLTVQRIPHGKKTYKNITGKPIILQHGFLDISTTWVLNIPEKNLAYRLADEGYDVWLGNIRGTSYGKQHTTLTAWQGEFWKFSFHEMGIYDMPAIIDYVLEVNGAKQVDYIGHSMGSMMMLVTLSTKPEYNDKVRIAQFFGPVAANNYMCTPTRSLLEFVPLLRLIPNVEMAPFFPIIRFFNRYACMMPMSKNSCYMTMFLAYGMSDRNRLNATRMPVYISHGPESTSIRTLLHILQLNNGKFHWYDHGKCENHKLYGQLLPPEYNLTKISTPIVLYWSDSDSMTSTLDIVNLVRQLKSTVLAYEIPEEKFNHMDFIRAVDADRLVYEKVLQVLVNPPKLTNGKVNVI